MCVRTCVRAEEKDKQISIQPYQNNIAIRLIPLSQEELECELSTHDMLKNRSKSILDMKNTSSNEHRKFDSNYVGEHRRSGTSIFILQHVSYKTCSVFFSEIFFL